MSTTTSDVRLEPRFEERGSFRLAGYSRILTFDQVGEIPQLWQKFDGIWGNIPGQVDREGYGVCYVPPDGNPGCFGYFAAVKVAMDAEISEDMVEMMIPAHRYAVIPHEGHVTTFGDTIRALTEAWLPQSGYSAPIPGPGDALFFEHYAEDFNPDTGHNGMEVWQPLATDH
jgi:AraC family transcriptional regulator